MEAEYEKIIAEHEVAKRLSQEKIGQKLQRNEQISGQITDDLSTHLNHQVREMH